MTWNDAKRTLTIDARRGCYEGMLDERKLQFECRMEVKRQCFIKGKNKCEILVCHMILRTSFF